MTIRSVPLASISEVKLGRQRSPQNHTGPSMRKYLRAANVGWSGLILDDVKSMNFTESEMATFRLQSGDILLNEASGSPGEVGKPAMWNEEIEDCAFQNTLLRVRPTCEADSRYLLHFFSQQASSGAFARGSRGVGIHHLGQDALSKWPVPLPPLDEQRRIAAILDHAEDVRAKRRSVLRRLESLAQATFLEMFSHSIREIGTPLSHVVEEFRYGTSVRSTPVGQPVLRIPNIIGGSLDLHDLKFVQLGEAESARLRLRDGDLLFVRTNGNRENVGRCAVFSTESFREAGLPGEEVVYASYLIRARLNGRVLPRFVVTYLNGLGRMQLTKNSKTSAGQYNINVEGLRSVTVPQPPLDQQKAFLNRATVIEGHMKQSATQLAQLDSLVASLQSRAFSGQL